MPPSLFHSAPAFAPTARRAWLIALSIGLSGHLAHAQDTEPDPPPSSEPVSPPPPARSSPAAPSSPAVPSLPATQPTDASTPTSADDASSSIETTLPGQPKPGWSPLPEQPEKKQPREVNTLPLVSTNAPPPLIWKWPTFSTADYVISVAGGAITLAAAILPPRAKHSLSGPIGFDEQARKLLRAKSLGLRYDFRDASDIGLSLTVMWPFVADALTTAWWYRGSRETAEEMALIDLEALAVSGAIQGATNVFVSRERPFGPDCGTEVPNDSIDCHNSFHYRSFFSGHAAFSFTGAALICVHHMENELLGSPWDALTCGAGYAVAATTATFRVVADVHYASDVLLGAAVGTLAGYGVPLLHYRKLGGGARTREQANVNRVRLSLAPAPGGVGVVGIF